MWSLFILRNIKPPEPKVNLKPAWKEWSLCSGGKKEKYKICLSVCPYDLFDLLSASWSSPLATV